MQKSNFFNGFIDNLLFIKKALTLEELTNAKIKTDNFIPSNDILEFVTFDSNYGNTTKCQGVTGNAELHNMSMSSWQESTIKPYLVTLENIPSSTFKLPGDYISFSGEFTSSILSNPINGTLSVNDENYIYTPATDFSDIDSLSYQLFYSDGENNYISKTAKYYFNVVPQLDVSENNLTPDNISMQQNYPNPFNPETTITFSIGKEANISLLIYNTQEQMVKKLLSQKLKEGKHTCLFKANHPPSGSYYYKLKVNNKEITKKILLIK